MKGLRRANNAALRAEYERSCKRNAFTRTFLDTVYPYMPDNANRKHFVFPEADSSPVEALPVIDLSYTAKVVDSVAQREMQKDLALPFAQIAQSTEAFPVDFDQAWEWIGYSTKGNAKRKLEADFVKGVDFNLINIDKVQIEGGRQVARPTEEIHLTIDCFKQFCMMAGTERGSTGWGFSVRVHRSLLPCTRLWCPRRGRGQRVYAIQRIVSGVIGKEPASTIPPRHPTVPIH